MTCPIENRMANRLKLVFIRKVMVVNNDNSHPTAKQTTHPMSLVFRLHLHILDAPSFKD